MRKLLITAILLSGLGQTLSAADTIRRKGVEKAIVGEVTSASREEVVIKLQVGGKEEKIPANEIDSIKWDAPTQSLLKATATEGLLKKGEFDRAIEAWEEALREGIAREVVKLDAEYSLARALYKKSLVNRDFVKQAVDKLKEFSKKDHFRSFDGVTMLGDLALSTGDLDAANIAFNQLAKAPWLEMQMAGKIGSGRALLAKKDINGAKKLFDEAANASAKSGLEKSRQFEAFVGQAHCLLELKQPKDALVIVEKVIQDAGEDDSRAQAEAYVRQGDCQRALGEDQKKTLLAYLHVDVIPEFAEHRDVHAEALYRLSQLWPAVGEKDRGTSAAERLKENYPDSEWAKMPAQAKEKDEPSN